MNRIIKKAIKEAIAKPLTRMNKSINKGDLAAVLKRNRRILRKKS